MHFSSILFFFAVEPESTACFVPPSPRIPRGSLRKMYGGWHAPRHCQQPPLSTECEREKSRNVDESRRRAMLILFIVKAWKRTNVRWVMEKPQMQQTPNLTVPGLVTPTVFPGAAREGKSNALGFPPSSSQANRKWSRSRGFGLQCHSMRPI